MGLLLNENQKFSKSSIAGNFLQVQIQGYSQKNKQAKVKADKALQD